MADFGPRITVKIVDSLREDIYAGKLKSGGEIKVITEFLNNLKSCYIWLLRDLVKDKNGK